MGLSEDLLLMQGHCPFGECLFGNTCGKCHSLRSGAWFRRKYAKNKGKRNRAPIPNGRYGGRIKKTCETCHKRVYGLVLLTEPNWMH